VIQLRLARAIGHATWLRRGIRERLVRALVSYGRSRDERFDTLLHGHRFSGSIGNWIDRNVYLYGGYEQEIQSLIRHLGARGGIGAFVDIGANVGLHTLLASTLFSQVHAFEPYPVAHERLAALVLDNRIENVVLHAVAVGSKDAELPFFAPHDSNLGTGSFLSDYSLRNKQFKTLPVVAGDGYFAASVGPVQTVKIDVEGYEVEVLRGLRKTLEQWRPDVIVEITEPTGRQLEGMSGLLDLVPVGYQIFTIEARRLYGWLFERPCLRLERTIQLADCLGHNCLMISADKVPPLRAAGLVIA